MHHWLQLASLYDFRHHDHTNRVRIALCERGLRDQFDMRALPYGLPSSKARIIIQKARIFIQKAGIFIQNAGIFTEEARIIIHKAGILIKKAEIFFQKAKIIIQNIKYLGI